MHQQDLRSCDNEKQTVMIGLKKKRIQMVLFRINTTDLTGEYGDRYFVATRGDSRIQIIIGRDAETSQLHRDCRFLVDDYASSNVLAYRLTKPFKLGSHYNKDGGIYKFVLTECSTEDTDNMELHIANYYKYYPKDCDIHKEHAPTEYSEIGKEGVWI